jgi:hypothetical protein
MSRLCKDCANCVEQAGTVKYGWLWARKERIEVTRMCCVGPELANTELVRGRWKLPAVAGPYETIHFVDGPCGFEGKWFEPKAA